MLHSITKQPTKMAMLYVVDVDTRHRQQAHQVQQKTHMMNHCFFPADICIW